MIVASLTTHAPRLPHIRPALESIVGQRVFDVVLLHVAKEDAAQAIEIARPLGVRVHVCPDVGPGKKHLSGLVVDDPEAIIVTFDDDHRYKAGHARKLVAGVRARRAACGFVGFALPTLRTVYGGPCDFLSGAQGWAYRRAWVPPEAVLKAGRDPMLWHSDDVALGAILARRGVGCEVVGGSTDNRFPPTNAEAYLHPASLQFHPDRDARTREAVRAAWGARSWGAR